METDLLDLSLSHWSIIPLHILPAVINFGLLIYVVKFMPQSAINWTYSRFIFLLAIGQISDAMMHMSSSYETAAAWQRISFAPWALIAPMGLLFVVSSILKKPLPGWFNAIMFIPAIVFLLLIVAHFESFTIVNVPAWGWIANPDPTRFNFVVFSFITGALISMPILLWSFYIKSLRDRKPDRRLLLLAIGVSIPFAGGIVGEVIFPLIFGMDNLPVAAPLLTTFSVCSFIAIRKYNMLEFTPQQQWDRILETIREGILIADNNRKIMYANPAICHLLEYEEAELIGKEADALVLKNSLHGTAFSADREFQMETKSGEKIWVVSNLSACMDHQGKRIGTIWTVTDIDDLKQKGLEVIRSEKRLSRAQEVAHVGHWDLDFKTGVAIWSSEACRIYGIPPGEKLQNFEKWISLIHPEDLPYVMQQIGHSQETYTDTDFEHRILLPDGTVKHIRSISKFEFDGTSTKPSGLYGVCQDITEIKIARERLTATTNELETYIYKSSHDLHAPLSSILGLINVSRREVKDPLAAQYLQMIDGQARKLDAIRTEFIKAMLIKDAAKFDECVPLHKMISEILENLRSTHGFDRLHVNVTIPEDMHLRSNTYLMQTILQNLIENSVKYQDYNQRNSLLNINVEQIPNNVKITIEDNGIGIAPALQDRIFDMYFRASEIGHGSGLGLYLVKKAVDKLNGKLQLRSYPGEGTTVTIQLATTAFPLETTSQIQEDIEHHSETVLAQVP